MVAPRIPLPTMPEHFVTFVFVRGRVWSFMVVRGRAPSRPTPNRGVGVSVSLSRARSSHWRSSKPCYNLSLPVMMLMLVKRRRVNIKLRCIWCPKLYRLYINATIIKQCYNFLSFIHVNRIAYAREF